jgi:hypothetical protein
VPSQPRQIPTKCSDGVVIHADSAPGEGPPTGRAGHPLGISPTWCVSCDAVHLAWHLVDRDPEVLTPRNGEELVAELAGLFAAALMGGDDALAERAAELAAAIQREVGS